MMTFVAFLLVGALSFVLGIMNGFPQGDGQDRKFAFRNGRFVNRVSGEPIPLDEPIMIFRARDKHAVDALRYYHKLLGDPHHRSAVAERIMQFEFFAIYNVHKMKEPGITRDIRLGGDRELQLGAHMEVP